MNDEKKQNETAGGEFVKPFSTIKNPAILNTKERRRLPLLGKIRLGVIAQTKGGGERPCDVPYFVVPNEVAAKYGDKPTELPVLFPTDSIPVIFPQALKWYGATGLKCIGDGQQAKYFDEKTLNWQPKECPCRQYDEGDCKLRATLFVMLYELNMGGVYQIVSSSSNSIIDIESGLEFHRDMLTRFSRVPLILRRVEKETTYIDKAGKRHKSVHYPLIITSKLSLAEAQRIRNDNSLMSLTAPQKQPAVLLPVIREDADNPLNDPDARRVNEDEVKDLERDEIIDAETGAEDQTPPEEKAAPNCKALPPAAPATPPAKPTEKPKSQETSRQSAQTQPRGALKMSDKQRNHIFVLAEQTQIGKEDVKTMTHFYFKKDLASLSLPEANGFINLLIKYKNDAKKEIEVSCTPEGEFHFTDANGAVVAPEVN